MSFEFLSRRHLFGCTGALVLTAVVPGLAHSASEPPINDVLSGVGDAADRQRLRQEARKGQWDGQYWNKDGKRYTSGQYRDHLLGNTRPQTSRPPQAPARRDYSQPYRPGTPVPRPGMVPNPPGRSGALHPEQSVSSSAGRSGTRSRRLRQRRRDAPMSSFSSFFPQAQNRQGIFCILAGFASLNFLAD